MQVERSRDADAVPFAVRVQPPQKLPALRDEVDDVALAGGRQQQALALTLTLTLALTQAVAGGGQEAVALLDPHVGQDAHGAQQGEEEQDLPVHHGDGRPPVRHQRDARRHFRYGHVRQEVARGVELLHASAGSGRGRKGRVN